MEQFLAGIGDAARRRPEPTLKGAIVAAAGVLVAIGLFALAINNNGDGGINVLGVLLSLGAVGVGNIILLRLPPEVAPAGVALAALGTVATIGFLFADADSATIPFVLGFLLLGAQWAAGPAKGASTLLTLSLLSFWALIIDSAAGDPTETVIAETFEIVPSNSFIGADDTAAYLSLILGVGLLLAARALDLSGYRGVASSAIIVGDLSFVVGSFGLIATLESEVLAGVVILLGGVVLAWIGSIGERRFTTWLGGIGVLVGLLVFLDTAVGIEDVNTFGPAAIVVGAAVILGAAFLNLTLEDGKPVIATAPVSEAPTAPSSGPAPEPEPEAATSEPVAELPATPPTAEPSPRPEPAWHPDPTGRHELRWHDGDAWTANVSDNGVTSTDEGV